MTVQELTELIEMAKEATENVWGDIKRFAEPTDSNSEESWKLKGQYILDNVAMNTYLKVLDKVIPSRIMQDMGLNANVKDMTERDGQ